MAPTRSSSSRSPTSDGGDRPRPNVCRYTSPLRIRRLLNPPKQRHWFWRGLDWLIPKGPRPLTPLSPSSPARTPVSLRELLGSPSRPPHLALSMSIDEDEKSPTECVANEAQVNQREYNLEQVMTAYEKAKANAAAGESGGDNYYTVLLQDQCGGNHVCIGQVGGKHLAIRGAVVSVADVDPLPEAAVVRKRLTLRSGQSLLVTIYDANARDGARYTVEMENEEVSGCGGSQDPPSGPADGGCG